MKIARYEDIPVAGSVGQGFRSGEIAFRDLLVGYEGRPDNFGLQMVEVPTLYTTPRHRHNFEQVRIMLEGSFGFGPAQIQEAGSIGYFCEGTYYTQRGEGFSRTLLLQLGGPSGAGFMSRRQLRQGIRELSNRGQFKEGVFSWLDAAGKKHNQDSYEAVWQHVFGKKVLYPKPQYQAPILMQPERFAWVDVPGHPGVSMRRLGRFNERGLEIAQLQLRAGTRTALDGASQPWLLFCTEGEGAVRSADQPEQSWQLWTSLHCERGDLLELHAQRPSIFYLIGLPVFD